MRDVTRKLLGRRRRTRKAQRFENRVVQRGTHLANLDVLNLSLPVPFLRSRPMLSKTLEWSLNLCIIKYVFDEQGQLRPVFTRDVHKRLLSDGYVLSRALS